MDMVGILRSYQKYNPETGEFDRFRTSREYAALLGIHESQLSRIYDDPPKQLVSLKVLRGLALAFPNSPVAAEIATALAAEPEREAVAS